jgi:hypothetical protein
VRLRDDSLSHQEDVSMPEASDRHGGDNIPPPVTPVARSNTFSDPAFMEHVVRAVAAEWQRELLVQLLNQGE